MLSALAAWPGPRDACGVASVRPIFLFLWAAVAFATAARAEAWPVRGAVAGELKIGFLPELGLAWSAEAISDGLVLRATRPGVELELAARPAPGGAWRWTVRRGRVDLGELWPMLREKLGAAAAGWSASGRVELAGEGGWSSDTGPTGEVRVALREGWARSDALGVELGGVELDAATRDPAAGTLPPGQILRVGRITAGRMTAEGLTVAFGLNEARVLEVEKAEAGVLGGRLRLRPFALSLAEPAVDTSAEVEGLSLAEAARLVPWAVAAANGRLKGRVEIDWSMLKGLNIRGGGLSIVKNDEAEFRLAPAPGFLTGNMPKRLAGVLVNPAVAPLHAIEMGEVALRIESLTVDFQPGGAQGGRSAQVRVLARPSRVDLAKVRQLTIDVNLYGPLADALALGMGENVKLRWR